MFYVFQKKKKVFTLNLIMPKIFIIKYLNDLPVKPIDQNSVRAGYKPISNADNGLETEVAWLSRV